MEYQALALMRRSLARLPLARAVRVGAAIGSLAFRLDRISRPVAMRNLEIAFPDRPASERLSILADMYRHWGRMAAEWAHMGDLNPANITETVVYQDRPNWDRAIDSSDGRGILVLTGHFGNFELMPVAQAIYGTPIAIVQRKLRNPYLDADVAAKRTVFGNRLVDRKGAAREIVRLLRNNWMVAVPIDLDVRGGVFVDFFSLKACTTTSLARLAMASGAPVLPGFMVREGTTTRHRIVVRPHLEVVRDRDREAAVLENTQRFTNEMEWAIRSHPDHWNWVHRRWKTRPPGQPQIY